MGIIGNRLVSDFSLEVSMFLYAGTGSYEVRKRLGPETRLYRARLSREFSVHKLHTSGTD